MSSGVFRITAILVIGFGSMFASSQQVSQPSVQQKPAPQTARQAIIEMLSGSEDAIMRHLTNEIQQMIRQQTSSAKSQSADTRNSAGKQGAAEGGGEKTTYTATSIGFDGMFGFRLPGMRGFPWPAKDFQTFDSGPVLFSYTDQSKNQKLEARVDSDDLSGDEDRIQLSFHIFNDGQEENLPYLPNITVGMKQQDKLWRLNHFSATFDLAVGDPKFFENIMNAQKEAKETKVAAGSTAAAASREIPPQPISQTVTMLGFAETMYAQEHPETGFTCNLADLFAQKGAASVFSDFLDPAIATGAYNGYRFNISGCDNKPSEIFHLVAEPLAQGKGAKAYCIDATRNVRISDDGRGSTCLTSGKFERGNSSTE